MVSNNKRLDYNDLAKSLGMLAIIYGHIRLTGWSNSFLYAWHIPLFFFLSGMVFNKNKYVNFKTFFIKKIKSLLVPYVIFSFITWIVWAVFSHISHVNVESYWMPLAQTFIAQGSGGYLIHNVPLWFVTCLFIMEIFYYFLSELHKGCIMIFTVILAACSYYMITYVKSIDVTLLPWNLEVVCLGLPIFATGHLLVQKYGHLQMQDWVKKHRFISLTTVLVLAVIVIIGSHYNGSISFGHAKINNPLITYPCALAGIIMILLVSMLLANTKACQNNTKFMNRLKWFGQNSFSAMAIHNPIKGVVCIIVGTVFGCDGTTISKSDSYSLIVFIVTLVVTVIGIMIINWVKNLYNNITPNI